MPGDPNGGPEFDEDELRKKFEEIRESIEEGFDAEKIEVEEGFKAIVAYYHGIRSTGLPKWDSAILTAAFIRGMGDV